MSSANIGSAVKGLQANRKIARDYWIFALLIMSLLPLGVTIFLVFLMTFLTLTFLDESLYDSNQDRF